MAGESRLRKAAVAVTATFGLVVAGWVTVDQMSEDEPDVYVHFADASPLIKGNDVKSAGVKVGTIGSIEVQDGVAKVGLVLDDEVLPLHDDATVRVRPVGLLGERFVELERGSPDAPVLRAGASLPMEQSTRATDLDEVLNMVDAPTGAALSMLVTTLGQGLLGHGENADLAIKALAPALKDTDRLGQILEDQNAVLQQLVDAVSPVLAEVAVDRGTALDELVGAAEKTLSATASQDKALKGTLEQLPTALREARATLSALSGAAGATAPVLAALRPATDNLVAVSRELQGFADSAEPALESLDPVLDEADVLLSRARPVARTLAEVSGDLRAVARDGGEIGTMVLDNLAPVLDFVRNWAMTTNGQDGLSHYFRAHLVVTTEIVGGLIPNSKPVPKQEKKSQPKGPLEGLLAPLEGLTGSLGGLTAPLDGLLGSLLGGKTGKGRSVAEGGSATGLSAPQEKDLLSYLIGGR